MRMTLALLLLATGAHAEEAATFLKVGVGARAQGMAGTQIAASDDVSAVYWNPAGLALLTKREASFMHAELAKGMRYDFVGYAQPTAFGTFGASAMHLGQRSLQGRDSTGRITGEFGAADTAMGLSFGRALSGRLGVGATVRFVRSRIADASGESVALDAGTQVHMGQFGPGRLRLGGAVQSMGPGLRLGGRTSPLPLSLGLGAGYSLPLGLNPALDIRHRPNAAMTEVSVGTEYGLARNFSLRAGYASNHGPVSGSGAVSDLTGFRGGVRSQLLEAVPGLQHDTVRRAGKRAPGELGSEVLRFATRHIGA